MPKNLITKAIQTAIDEHDDLIWIQDHLRNIFLCRIRHHENGREIIRKMAGFYIPEELERALNLHHAVFDAIKDARNRPLISVVLGSFVWKGLVDPNVLSRETEREMLQVYKAKCPHTHTIDQGPDGVLCTDCGETVCP